MGNRGSTADNDWNSSDEGGGSDYEHAYNYHTSVLRKSPADGFESDCEEEDDDDNNRASNRRNAQPYSDSNTNAALATTSDKASENGDGAQENGQGEVNVRKEQNTAQPLSAVVGNSRDNVPSTNENFHAAALPDASGDARVHNSAAKSAHSVPPPAKQNVHAQNSMQPVTTNTRASGSHQAKASNSGSQQKQTSKKPTAADEEDVYETAGEEGRNSDVEDGDNDSLSTITPPRQRPSSSESDFGMSISGSAREEEEDKDEESGSEDEEDESGSTATPTTVPRINSSRTQNEVSPSTSHSSSLRSRNNQQAVPRREGMSPDSYRQVRKQQASPKGGGAAKRSRLSDGVELSPNRTRFGVFDSESDSDVDSPPAPEPPPAAARPMRDTKSLSARTIRQAAKRAASQFVETSRRILRDAKTAARILKEAASPPKRQRTNSNEASQRSPTGHRSGQASPRSSPGQSSVRETRSSSRREAAEHRRAERLSQTAEPSERSPRTRRGAAKRNAEDVDSDVDTEPYLPRHTESELSEAQHNDQSSRQVRKDGGRLRKFTRSTTDATAVSASRQSPGASGSAFSPPNIRSNSQPAFVAPTTSKVSSRKRGPSSPESTHNPFSGVTLVPTSSQSLNNSTDSISGELDPQGIHSPFVSLARVRDLNPTTATFTAGSVWSRINTRASPQQQTSSVAAGHSSPVPGTSGQKMATRSSPRFDQMSASAISDVSPSRTTPSAQFAHSGRFAFLLEDTVQVTVASGNLTMATTSAIVITNDSRLQHSNTVSHTVATAAGSDFMQACKDYLSYNPRGLQVCEVVDTPAGGHLCPLISRVLHVVVPDGSTLDARQQIMQRKLLLCTYLNCLKHASEKLGLGSLAFPLIGSGTYSADECIQVFFDSLLVYLAERTPTCPLYAVHLIVNSPAVGRFAAEVLEARLDAIATEGVDAAMATVFRDYFNIPDFSRSASAVTVGSGRSSAGKPAIKRRRL